MIRIPNPFRSRAQEDDFLKFVRSSAQRKLAASQRLDFYNDRQADETLRLIRQRFKDANSFRVFALNVLRRIVDKSATTYRVAPRRVFTGWEQEAGEALYRAANADAVLKRACRMTRLLKTTMLRAAWVDDKPALHLVTPAILDVVAPDPERPERVIITHAASNPADVTYSDWTANTYTLRDSRGNAIKRQDNTDNANPYGAVPFVPCFDYLPDADFFLPGGDDLIECQSAINVALANLWRSVELQAHGQAWASGIKPDTALNIGPERAILLPESGKFGFAAPNSPIADILEAIEFVMRQLAATNAVGSDVFDLSKSAISGSAQAAARLDLKEARSDDIAMWRVTEGRLFDVIKAVVNAHAPGTIPERATVRVDFAEQQDQLTEAETLENAQRKQALGVSSPVDSLMALNPDGFATREDAFAELMRRKREAEDLAMPL